MWVEMQRESQERKRGLHTRTSEDDMFTYLQYIKLDVSSRADELKLSNAFSASNNCVVFNPFFFFFKFVDAKNNDDRFLAVNPHLESGIHSIYSQSILWNSSSWSLVDAVVLCSGAAISGRRFPPHPNPFSCQKCWGLLMAHSWVSPVGAVCPPWLVQSSLWVRLEPLL